MEELTVHQEVLSLAEKNMLAYFETHDVKYVAEDAVFKNFATGQEHKGKADIGAMLHYMYHVAFDAKAEFTSYIITENKAQVEGFFKGRHIGEFAGIKPTNKEVNVPLCVTYKLKHGLIKEAHVFMVTDVLFQQLGVHPTFSQQKTEFVVRDIFQLKFGHYRDVKALLDEALKNDLFPEARTRRILTDFTGDAYRLVLEEGFDTLGEYELSLTGGMATPEFQNWYQKFKPHVERSYREILKQVQ